MPTHSHDSTVQHYRHQARHLHQALRSGSAAAAVRVARHLPRLSGASPNEVLAAAVGLQEAQHVVAKENGYRQWEELVAADAPRFEDIVRLSNADLRVLLREVENEDLALVLSGLARSPVSRRHHAVLGMFRQLPPEAQDEIRQRARSLGDDEDAVVVAQARIARQARILEEKGVIRPTEPPAVPTSAPSLPEGLEVWERPLLTLSPEEEIDTGLHALAEVHAAGYLQATIPADSSAYVWEGVRLIADNTEPELVRDLMETHAQTALREVDLRWRMAIEATVAIAFDANPRIMPLKLAALYTTDKHRSYRETEGTVSLALERLQRTPASRMSLDEITEFYTDLAWIARLARAVRDDRLAVFTEVADAVDDEFMAWGLRLLAERVPLRGEVDDAERSAIIDGIKNEMEEDVAPRLAQVKRRYQLVCEGIVALCEGRIAEELASVLDGVTVEDEVRIYRH